MSVRCYSVSDIDEEERRGEERRGEERRGKERKGVLRCNIIFISYDIIV